MSDTTIRYNRAALLELINEHEIEYRRNSMNAKSVLFPKCSGDGTCMDGHEAEACTEENGEDCTCSCDCDSREVQSTEAGAFAALAQAAAAMAHTAALMLPYSA